MNGGARNRTLALDEVKLGLDRRLMTLSLKDLLPECTDLRYGRLNVVHIFRGWSEDCQAHSDLIHIHSPTDCGKYGLPPVCQEMTAFNKPDHSNS